MLCKLISLEQENISLRAEKVSLQAENALLRTELAARKRHTDDTPFQMYSFVVEKLTIPVDGREYRLPFSYVNPTQVATVGKYTSPEEMIGKDDFDCFKKKSALKTYEDFLWIIENKCALAKEEILFDTLGRKHIFRVTKTPVIVNGTVVAINGISIDITREKYLEKRFEDSFKLSPTPMDHLDAQSNIILQANKMYHIANEYCISLPEITFTDKEIRQINNSYSMHFYRDTESANVGTLCITPLVEPDSPEVKTIRKKNDVNISQALANIHNDEYRLIGKNVDILNVHVSTSAEKKDWKNKSINNSPYCQEVNHRTRTGKIKTFLAQTHAHTTGDGRTILEGVDYDITEAVLLREELNRKNAELIQANVLLEKQKKQMEELALHDPLTGLASRRLLEENSLFALNGAKRHQSPPEYVGFIFMDLDGLKPINDTYGHGAGDAAILYVSNQIKSITRASDTCARYGGDEFVILCTGIKNPKKEMNVIKDKLREVIEKKTLPSK